VVGCLYRHFDRKYRASIYCVAKIDTTAISGEMVQTGRINVWYGPRGPSARLLDVAISKYDNALRQFAIEHNSNNIVYVMIRMQACSRWSVAHAATLPRISEAYQEKHHLNWSCKTRSLYWKDCHEKTVTGERNARSHSKQQHAVRLLQLLARWHIHSIVSAECMPRWIRMSLVDASMLLSTSEFQFCQ